MAGKHGVLEELSEELGRVDGCIDEFLRAESPPRLLREIIDTVRGSKGKMLRPALLLLSGRLGPEHAQNREQLYRLAAAVEMVHTASLVHDDIVDDSPLRRGRASVQSRFGKDVAVYTGDFLLCRVMFHMMDDDLDKAVGKRIARTVEQMCLGEVGQYENRWNTEATIEQYLQNIYGKTAAMFVAACQLGAVVAGAEEETVELLGEFGEALGILFQLRDDLLDYTSSVEAEKKPVNLDFSSGIYTMPVLHAFRHEKHGPRLKELARLVREEGGDHRGEVNELVSRGGGIRFTRGFILRQARRAEGILKRLPHGETSAAMGKIVHSLCKEWKKDGGALSRTA